MVLAPLPLAALAWLFMAGSAGGAKISGPYRRWLAAQAKERTVADSRVLPTRATGRRSPARKAAVPLPVVPIRRCDSTYFTLHCCLYGQTAMTPSE